MTVKELIKKLKEVPENCKILVFDSGGAWSFAKGIAVHYDYIEII